MISKLKQYYVPTYKDKVLYTFISFSIKSIDGKWCSFMSEWETWNILYTVDSSAPVLSLYKLFVNYVIWTNLIVCYAFTHRHRAHLSKEYVCEETQGMKSVIFTYESLFEY